MSIYKPWTWPVGRTFIILPSAYLILSILLILAILLFSNGDQKLLFLDCVGEASCRQEWRGTAALSVGMSTALAWGLAYVMHFRTLQSPSLILLGILLVWPFYSYGIYFAGDGLDSPSDSLSPLGAIGFGLFGGAFHVFFSIVALRLMWHFLKLQLRWNPHLRRILKEHDE